MASLSGQTEPFPTLPGTDGNNQSSGADGAPSSPSINRPGASSSLSKNLRRVSQSFGEYNPPEGFLAATGKIASSMVSRPRVSSGATLPVTPPSPPSRQGTFPPLTEETTVDANREKASPSLVKAAVNPSDEPKDSAPLPNGYHFPPSHTFMQSTALGLRAFWKFFLTPMGFCWTIYGLNVVAWGGMIFLLLCNAAPAMCHPSCNHIDSPRRKWIEWDSQILNALFCVTGFGLAPWRFRDLYYLLQYRVMHKQTGLRRLAGIHRGWFRLEGSTGLPIDLGPNNVDHSITPERQAALPYPESKVPDAPLTEQRAPPTKMWKLDTVIWLMVWNTILQCCLAGLMWGMNRYDRPSWSTGFFVALACLVAGVGGYIMFDEGRKVKSIEGVPVSQRDLEQLERDREKGVWHYNNIKDKDLSKKAAKKASKKSSKSNN